MTDCPFCLICEGKEAASIIYEDELVLAIVPYISAHPESAVIFPRVHVDHFDDLPHHLVNRIMDVGIKISKKIKQEYNSERVGMLVHGYGVAHAHLNVFPQNHPHDVTSRHFIYLENNEICFDMKHVPKLSRLEMDEIAARLKLG